MSFTKEQIEKKQNRILKTYQDKVFRWVNARIICIEDAEEITQDIMRQVFKSFGRIYENDTEIKNINAYIMKIAHNVLNTHFKKDKRYSINNFTIRADKSESLTKEVIIRLSNHLAHFTYNKREAMMMYYIDKKPLKEIAKILNTTPAYVKQILYKSRLLLQEKAKILSDDFNYEYHPDYLRMTLSGESIRHSDTQKINESLSKQHICITCYKQPCTIEKIGEITRIPQAIIEYDLEWLLEKDFIKRKNNSYYTNFIIIDFDIKVLLMNIYMKHKAKFSDVIIEKLIAYEGKIRKIGFIGSNRPYDKLLWFLTYTFADFSTMKTCFGISENPYLNLRPDGGHYIPVGYHRNSPTIPINPDYYPKYHNLINWVSDGTYLYIQSGWGIKWLGLKNRQNERSNKTAFNDFIPETMKYKNILHKCITPDFKIDSLTPDEKIVLDIMIEHEWIYTSSIDGKIIPNFLVFTLQQRKQIYDLYEEIYHQMNPDFEAIYGDLKKMCKKTLPKKIHHYFDYSAYLSLLINHAFTIGYGYTDGKLYKPKNDKEWEILTLAMFISDNYAPDEMKNYTNLLRARDI